VNIYVGNLPKSATEELVKQAFQEFGEVSEVKLIKDRYSGELRGFGFVEMPSKTEAIAAIKEVDGMEMDGRKLIVNEARPRKSSTGGRRGGGGGFNRGRGPRW